MELVIKSNDENSIAEILTLAKKLNVVIEKYGMETEDIEVIKKRLLNFKPKGASSISDPMEWQREQRVDRDLPFLK